MTIKISTHAPLAGRDLLPYIDRRCRKYFNPRAPCGARLKTLRSSSPIFVFQPTRPLRGATHYSYYWIDSLAFQPTRPLRGATWTISQANAC